MEAYEWWTGVVQTVGLVGLGWYVWETRRIRKISFEALEAPVKPRVSPVAAPDWTDNAVIESAQQGQPIPLRLPPGQDVQLFNGGAGPALNLRIRILKVGESGPEEAKPVHDQHLPLLDTGVLLPTRFPVTALPSDCELLLTFESVNGVQYEGRVRIEGRSIVRQLSVKPVGRR